MNDQKINELVRRTGRDRSHLYGPHGIDPMRSGLLYPQHVYDYDWLGR